MWLEGTGSVLALWKNFLLCGSFLTYICWSALYRILEQSVNVSRICSSLPSSLAFCLSNSSSFDVCIFLDYFNSWSPQAPPASCILPPYKKNNKIPEAWSKDLGQSQGLSALLSVSQGSLYFAAWYLMAWKVSNTLARAFAVPVARANVVPVTPCVPELPT